MGHGGKFWQNVDHWIWEWQATSEFLSWEPHEQFEGMKMLTQNGKQKQKQKNTQLWMCLVVKVKSNAVKNNIA